jgi:hypothetical protein
MPEGFRLLEYLYLAGIEAFNFRYQLLDFQYCVQYYMII